MRRCLILPFALVLCSLSIGQDRLQTMPRFDRYQKITTESRGAYVSNEVSPTWGADGKGMSFRLGGKTTVIDLATGKISEGAAVIPTVVTSPPRLGGTRRNPERGRQFDRTFSADGKKMALFRDGNVYLADADGKNEQAITTDGNTLTRKRFGIGSWVYGEELNVREAMWFSPDGKYLAFYGFDDSKVLDYFLTLGQTQVQSILDTEAYPKAGTDNPVVELYVVDLFTKERVKVDKSFGDSELGHYVYDVTWSPRGDELLYKRTNRKQSKMQFCAASPSGKSRVIIEENQPNSWAENHPFTRWLSDNQSFLWMSERTGFDNLYLAHIDGRPLRPITSHGFEVSGVTRVDEKAQEIWYTARSGDNPYLHQLHRVKFDGKGDVRLTDPKLNHAVNISPDGKYFTDNADTYEDPNYSSLRDRNGKLVAELSRADLTKFTALNLQKLERLKFKAADGITDIYGYLQKPSDFDPAKKYPLLVSLYAGPDSGTREEGFRVPPAICEMGFLVAWFDGRGTQGRGKAFKDSVYGKLGVVEIDDQAAGAKYLMNRPYVQGVGVYGTSYGGYASIMCILRYPEVFSAAVASSAVTKWENYDTIYTERYMGLPWATENKAGYDAANAMTYAKNLKGRLMLFFGTADNNVHPSNTFQLVQALQRAGKSFDLMAGPDQGHAGINQTLMWEYFMDALVLKTR
ncbi:MAG: DPP IV N-terminal domain-containing protein [Fimbriimonadaceae bacterium]